MGNTSSVVEEPSAPSVSWKGSSPACESCQAQGVPGEYACGHFEFPGSFFRPDGSRFTVGFVGMSKRPDEAALRGTQEGPLDINVFAGDFGPPVILLGDVLKYAVFLAEVIEDGSRLYDHIDWSELGPRQTIRSNEGDTLAVLNSITKEEVDSVHEGFNVLWKKLPESRWANLWVMVCADYTEVERNAAVGRLADAMVVGFRRDWILDSAAMDALKPYVDQRCADKGMSPEHARPEVLREYVLAALAEIVALDSEARNKMVGTKGQKTKQLVIPEQFNLAAYWAWLRSEVPQHVKRALLGQAYRIVNASNPTGAAGRNDVYDGRVKSKAKRKGSTDDYSWEHYYRAKEGLQTTQSPISKVPNKVYGAGFDTDEPAADSRHSPDLLAAFSESNYDPGLMLFRELDRRQLWEYIKAAIPQRAAICRDVAYRSLVTERTDAEIASALRMTEVLVRKHRSNAAKYLAVYAVEFPAFEEFLRNR